MFTPPRPAAHSGLFCDSPVASLSRELPQGADADILVFGRNDVRSILFTAYCERGLPLRKFDVTWCHEDEAITARDLIFFTLLLDGEADSDASWDLYFHFYVGESSAEVLRTQATKLLALSESLSAWNESVYGQNLKFCDEGSMILARNVWQQYVEGDWQSGEAAVRYEKLAERFRNHFAIPSDTKDDSFLPTGTRSASPLTLAAIKEAPQSYEDYGEHGTFAQPSTMPNPVYAASFFTGSTLAPAVNPLLGFHLATAFARLAPTSPLGLNRDDNSAPRLVLAAKTQFHEWCAAFREIAKDRFIIRFSVVCPLTFCQTLQHNSATHASSANQFRRQLDLSYYELDSKAYGSTGTAPRLFDVIDASNSFDQLGAMNILVSSSPLLKIAASSTLYMEIPRLQNETYKESFDSMLFGHPPTISLLLGLVPVEYWTNATPVSYVDELMLTSSVSTHAQTLKSYAWLSWKLAGYLLGQTRDISLLTLNPADLAKILHAVYVQTLQRPPKASDGCKLLPHKTAGNGHVRHPGNFVGFVKQVLYSVNVDRTKACEIFLDLLRNDASSVFGREYYVELAHQLHLRGVYGGDSALSSFSMGLGTGNPRLGSNVLESSCVVVRVPREALDKILDTGGSTGSDLLLEAIISLEQQSSEIMRARFTGLQLAFGEMEVPADWVTGDFSDATKQEHSEKGDRRSLVISFDAPTTWAEGDLKARRIAVVARRTQNDTDEPEVPLFETVMSDEHHVSTTRRSMVLNALPITSARAVAITSSTGTTETTPANTTLTANIDQDNGHISTMISVVKIIASDGRPPPMDMRTMLLRQTSPCNFEIGFKGDAVYKTAFPTPVLKDTIKRTVDPKSGTVTLSAPLAGPLDLDGFPELICPISLGTDSVPATLNSVHVNLDSLPVLSVEEDDKQANQWLVTLTSHQFSVRERRAREALASSPLKVPAPPRLSFKESLFTIFMVASGLQGGSTGLFALADQERGNQVLLFVRALRLDGAAGSVVADAAALPLTRELVDSRELETFLLVLRELEICVIDVDDAELVLWKRVLPAFAERCRIWSHGPGCEYKRPGACVPLTLLLERQFMCTCGNGRLPADYIRLPEWDVASRHAVRVAMSPTFSSPYVEDVVDVEMLRAQGGVEGLLRDKCRNCNATESKKGGRLLKCTRCRSVVYCSQECQRKDWKKHRMECKPLDD
ncbi:hypothetical protein DL768_003541 [Monosporascus sp. mg162]|nr:hypothetical protein DL768_003541 [Monosporascus sp. mg162]